jgi:hypothetical protein
MGSWMSKQPVTTYASPDQFYTFSTARRALYVPCTMDLGEKGWYKLRDGIDDGPVPGGDVMAIIKLARRRRGRGAIPATYR